MMAVFVSQQLDDESWLRLVELMKLDQAHEQLMEGEKMLEERRGRRQTESFVHMLGDSYTKYLR